MMKLKTKRKRRLYEVIGLRPSKQAKSARTYQVRSVVLLNSLNKADEHEEQHEPSTSSKASLPAKPSEEEVYAAGMKAFENLLNDYGDVLDALAKY